MSYSSLANNQTISFNNLQDAVNTGQLSQKATIPVSNEQITKDEANTYVNIDTAFAPYAAKASNQLVIKSNLKGVLANVVFTNQIVWFGIDNNETTSSPIQLLCGWNNSGDDGRIYRSTNFGSTYASVLTINQRLYRVKYLINLRHASYLSVIPFVAVGEGGRIVTNSVTDCTSWITISSPTTQDLFDIAFQRFSDAPHAVIVGNSRILRTTNVERINSWTIVNSISAIWRSVSVGGPNGNILTFVAVGDNSSTITSNNIEATSWSTMNMPPLTPSKQLRGVTYASLGDYWYAVGYDTANPNLAFIMRCPWFSNNWEIYNTTGDAFLSGLTSIEYFNTKLYIGGINYQYIIDLGTITNPKNTVTRFDASFSGYTTWWMSVTQDPITNGFDMAAGLSVTGNELNSENGGHSNF
jgi:hypothetical protein